MVDGYHITDLPRRMTGDITVTVGSGGDFSTINDALSYLVNNFFPGYYPNTRATKAKIRILSGTTINEQILIDGIDLSWITIESDDSTVPVNTNNFVRAPDLIRPFILGVNGARIPIINVLFNITTNLTNFVGIYLTNASWGYIMPNKGIKFSYTESGDTYAILAEHGSTLLGRNIRAEGPSNKKLFEAISVWYSIAFIPNSYCSNASSGIGGACSIVIYFGSQFDNCTRETSLSFSFSIP
jgi:hypothetical protein